MSRALALLLPSHPRPLPCWCSIDGFGGGWGREQILRIMGLNVRKPDLNIGDIKALVGALKA